VEVNELTDQNHQISPRAVLEELNIGLASVTEIIRGWVKKNYVLDGFHISLRLKWKAQGLKHVNDCSLPTEARGNFFLYSTLTGDESWVHHNYPEMKSYLNIAPPLFPEGKISRLNLVMGEAC